MSHLPAILNLSLPFFAPNLFLRYDPGTVLISSDVLIKTENAVFTADGRYFVAGEHKSLGWGIYEVVKTATGYAVNQIVPGILEVGSTRHACCFDGLTTDGRYLYATAAVHRNLTKIERGALCRILPGKNKVDLSVAHYSQDELHFYNGMAVGPDGSIYMSNSSALMDGSWVAIYKLTIIDQQNFEIQMVPWLFAHPLRDIKPNGIQIKDNLMYYVSGKGLYTIDIIPSGPGILTPIYATVLPNNLLDDLVLLPDNRAAIGEIDAVTALVGLGGLGINQIIVIDLTSPLLNKQITLTSPYTVSSLAYEEGDLFTTGKLIATDWLHGTIREFELP